LKNLGRRYQHGRTSETKSANAKSRIKINWENNFWIFSISKYY